MYQYQLDHVEAFITFRAQDYGFLCPCHRMLGYMAHQRKNGQTRCEESLKRLHEIRQILPEITVRWNMKIMHQTRRIALRR